MADDWDAFGSSRDDDGFPPGSSRDDDGFPADGNDVFGANVENVDVWGGHDSFDGDQEWFDFNGDDNDCDQDEEHQNDSDPGSPGNSDRRRRGSRSSNQDGDHRRRSSSRDRSQDRSRDRSQDRSGGSRRRSSSRDRSGDGHRRHDDAKRGRRPKPLKNDPTRSSSGRKSSSKNKDGGSDGFDENGFPAFDDSDKHDGGRSQKLRASRGSTSSRRHLGGVQTDDALASSYASSSRRLSGASGSRTLIRRRDGTVTRSRPSESGSRNSKSGERRDKVRDSLFGAIGDEGDQKGGVSLGNFLKDEKGGKPPRSSSDSRSVHSAPAVVSKGHRRHGGGSDRRSSGSHHSRGSHHDRDGSSHHGSPNKRDSRGHKNRRWSNRMGPPPEEEAESPQKAVEGAMGGLKVDIAALAEAGCIEVQDGKMRLVIDLDT